MKKTLFIFGATLIASTVFTSCSKEDSTHKKYYGVEPVNSGTPKEEARQVLPNASTVNIFITADARNLMYFFQQRRCSRNTAEMIQVADAMWKLCRDWFPELFSIVGPFCVMNGYCNQGGMQSAECKVRADNPSAD